MGIYIKSQTSKWESWKLCYYYCKFLISTYNIERGSRSQKLVSSERLNWKNDIIFEYLDPKNIYFIKHYGKRMGNQWRQYRDAIKELSKTNFKSFLTSIYDVLWEWFNDVNILRTWKNKMPLPEWHATQYYCSYRIKLYLLWEPCFLSDLKKSVW